MTQGTEFFHKRHKARNAEPLPNTVSSEAYHHRSYADRTTLSQGTLDMPEYCSGDYITGFPKHARQLLVQVPY